MPDLYVVTASGLNLRSEPVVKPSTRIVTLPEGAVVAKTGTASDADWWRVSVELDGVTFEGFVRRQYLAATHAPPQPAGAAAPVPEVHLVPKSTIRRDRSQGRAYPLNEPGQPLRAQVSPASLAAIIAWLDVERHERYLPKPGVTFCNIYAYDFCYLGRGFLPRVWWTAKALQRLAGGENVQPLYDNTVHELNANSLHDWLGDYGPSFGWRRVKGAGDLQDAANAGRLALITAKRKDLNRSGHICPVVPETATAQAVRSGGMVRVPLQSQAGVKNFRYGAGNPWWTGDKFSSFGFWAKD